jgi:DNA modification methylase
MTVSILVGDVREKLRGLPADSFDCVVTSPPYWGLRDYGVEGQIGLEPTLGEHLAVMVDVFREVRRVLKPSGTLWVNYGDAYCSTDKWGGGGSNTGKQTVAADGTVPSWEATRAKKPKQDGFKPKDLYMIPNRLAIALQDDGWWVRSEIVWAKPNAMPDSAGKYRPSATHEKIFLLTKSARSYYDHAAVAVPVSGNTHSRVARPYKMPDNWDTGPGGHGAFHRNGREKGRPGVTPKSAGEDTNVHAKGSFHASTTEIVETRYLRNYEPAPLSVWEIASQPFAEAHFATFAPELVERCLNAGCPEGGTVLDPFGGAGTTALVADQMQLDCTIIELNPEYVHIAARRIESDRGAISNALDPLQIDMLVGAA